MKKAPTKPLCRNKSIEQYRAKHVSRELLSIKQPLVASGQQTELHAGLL